MIFFSKYQKSHVVSCYAIAMVYALIIGNQSIVYRIFDGCIYGSTLLLTGSILWNIFRYVLSKHSTPINQVFIIIAIILLTSGFIVGIETFAVYLLHPSTFIYFVTTIPIRLFITCLIVVIFRLLYLIHNKAPKSFDKTTCNQPVTSTIDRITVRSGQKIRIIPIEEIIYIQADGDYISIHTNDGNYLKEQTMKQTENMLPVSLFIRIHRSYIVNINYISRIERYRERQQIILHNKEVIKISTARYQSLKQQLGI